MKRNRRIIIACIGALIALTATINACFSPYTGDGNVTVVVGNGSARSSIVMYADLKEKVTHSVTMSGGPGPTVSAAVTGETPATFSVSPGRWEVTVTALLGGGVIAAGSKSVDIKSGSNTVGVDMITIDSGDGSPDNPWIVYSEELLRKVGKDDASGWGLDDHYKLLGDITLTGGLWEPIGKHLQDVSSYNDSIIGPPFTGTFDGAGRTIFNMTINEMNAPIDIAQGMFSYLGGVVKNLRLEHVSVTNKDLGNQNEDCDVTGAIAGINAGTIENCSVSGVVSDIDGYSVGGIAGRNDGTIQMCSVSGDVIGRRNSGSSPYVGGIAGSNVSTYIDDIPYGGTISNCYANGSVYSGYHAGGIAGDNEGVIQNCYAENLLAAYDACGGISDGGIIQNCVALSPNITIADMVTDDCGRIAVSNYDTSCAGTYGRKDMMHNGNPYYPWVDNLPQDDDGNDFWTDGRDGTDVSASQYENPEWWKNSATWSDHVLTDFSDHSGPAGVAWDFTTVWDWDAAAKRPVLRKISDGGGV